MPHFLVPDTDRTADQKAEAQAWLTEFGQTMLEHLWNDFGALNERD